MVADLSFEEKVKELTQWFETNDSLPELIDDVVLRRFLYSMENDIEEAKKLIEHSYSMRYKYPNIFYDRDPIDEKINNIFNVADLGVPMPNLTSCKRRIVINRLIDHDPDKFDFDTIVKAFFLAADMRFAIRDDDLPLKINCGDIPIFDMSGLSYRHLTKLSFSTLRCYMRFTQEGFPVLLKEIHFINVSPVLSKLLTVIRPFMKTRVKNMLHYHEPNSSTFFEFIDQDLMPFEYGGKAGKMEDIKNDFTKQLESRRDYLTCHKRWKPRDKNNKIISNVNSKFADLSID